MKAWSKEVKEKTGIFFKDYGNVFVICISLSVSLVSLCLIISLASPQFLRVSFLDVGQGDAILIQTPSGHDMLIDGGPSDGVLSRLDDRMSYFDRDIDVVIATHDDADHITGLIPVLKKYDVDHVLRSPVHSETDLASVFASSTLVEEDVVVHVGTKGDVIDFGDGVMVYVLYPASSFYSTKDTNDASVSVLLKYGERTFLLAGDLSTKHELKLIGDHVPKHVTVFKAGHHGSKTSSGVQLLTYIKPEYAVISAGKDNKYGHPHVETLDRLSTYAKETLSTIDRGTITFISDGRIIDIETGK